MLLRRYKDKRKEVIEESKQESKPIEELTVPQLKELAKEKGHEGVSQLNKGQLIELLKGE